MDSRTRPDAASSTVDDATAAHAPVWTDAVPVASGATAAHPPVWTDAVPTSAEATAAHEPIWTRGTLIPAGLADTEDETVPGFELSMTAVLASAGAAVCAAILGSQLGVAGTLLGAALGAVVSMTAGAVFSHSLKTAHRQVQRAIAAGGPLYARAALAGVGRGPRRQDAMATTLIAPIGAAAGRSGSPDVPPAGQGVPAPSERAWGQVPDIGTPQLTRSATARATPSTFISTPRRRRRTVWALAGGALAGFALAVLAITGYEMISGTPVSGGDQGGLSVLGGGSAGSPDTDVVTTPSPTPSADSSSSSSTPSSTESTVTSTTTVTTTSDPSSSTSASTTSSNETSTSSTTTDSPSSTTSTSASTTDPTGNQTATTVTTPTPAGAAG